jgi:hypothetical protein
MKLNKTIIAGITLFTLFTQPIYLHALENSINNRTINIQEIQKTKLNKVEALSNEEINNLTSSNRFIKNLIDNNLSIKIANKIIEYVDSSYNIDYFYTFSLN